MAFTVVTACFDEGFDAVLASGARLVINSDGLIFQLGPEDGTAVTAHEVEAARSLAKAARGLAREMERLHRAR
ncbi:hypothetical protein O4J56_00210 [Nocardiopsis sp. RSe5-2]|uniref:Roadblock/LC7 domain-containing protein n=1 Tax=Nocardiopsis endophytica TaxID=3018445 RepID=A0ABT4TY32_9ACTN|nr:hypothetical protein [Nocardiopsis endophytica]MDA2809052.1 hypothetical protein [Nocardiopsis endophytica]